MVPGWLHLLSIFALVLGFATAGVIMIDVVRHPQHMWIMGRNDDFFFSNCRGGYLEAPAPGR